MTPTRRGCPPSRGGSGRRRLFTPFFLVGLVVGLFVALLVIGPLPANGDTSCASGHLSVGDGAVSAGFHVSATCAEVSLLSWAAPDAHGGRPQRLVDRRSATDVAPG